MASSRDVEQLLELADIEAVDVFFGELLRSKAHMFRSNLVRSDEVIRMMHEAYLLGRTAQKASSDA